jgi:hypothetical protein
MKINTDISIKISGGAQLNNALKGVAEGAEISARLIERLGGRFAMMEIAGQRIRAEFVRGVPSEKILRLALQEKSGNVLRFKIVSRDEQSAVKNSIMELSLRENIDIKKINVHKLNQLVSGDIISLMAFNSIILNKKEIKEQKDSPLTKFLNYLLKKGVKNDDLKIFSYLFFSRKGINIDDVLKMIHIQGRYGDQAESIEEIIRDEKKAGEWITRFIDDIKSLFNDNEDSGQILRGAIDSLRGNDRVDSWQFVLPYFDGNEFKQAYIMQSGGSLLCSLTLSWLRHIELLIRESDRMNISIFADNEKCESLKEDIGLLQDRINGSIDKRADIRVLSARYLREKVIEIYNSLCLISNLDIKA